MELLKDKIINGISFEIIREEYRQGYSSPFIIILRVTNFNDHKKKIRVRLDYISKEYGLKKVWAPQELIPDNTFFDFDFSYEEITHSSDGDRIELEINEGKFASLRLVRERGQWWIVESKERITYNRNLKNKIEHFEYIEEQFGITLQKFSVRVIDENSLEIFCEVMAMDGKACKERFNVELAIYDNEDNIVKFASISRFNDSFKGFEVFCFNNISLDITVDEISKIRIYPTR